MNRPAHQVWASLSNSPAPTSASEGPTLYQVGTMLMPEAAPFTSVLLKYDRVLETRPKIDATDLFDPASKLTRNRAPAEMNVARQAFRSPSRTTRSVVSLAVKAWNEDGWSSVLRELAGYVNRSGTESNSWLIRALGIVSAFALRFTDSFVTLHEWVNPTQLKSAGDDALVERFVSTRFWCSSTIRCMAWHPQASKLALALQDDTVHIIGRNLHVSPVLKHKQQRGVACVAWRPFQSSELALGCFSGILIWTVDPSSVVARPSANCVSLIPAPREHCPVTSIQYHPQGRFLISASPLDCNVILWCTESERQTPLRRLVRDGVHLVSLSPFGSVLLAASTCNAFKLVDTRTWNAERWNAPSGFINSACWSSCGSVLLFTTNQDAQVYSLKFAVNEVESSTCQASGEAVPVMDLTKCSFVTNDGEETCVGGLVQAMRWDPSGERLVLSFVHSELLAVFATKVGTGVCLTPIGFIRGLPNEEPSTFEFAPDFAQEADGGALLTVAWSSGRLQHLPMFFSSTPVSGGQSNSYLLNASPVLANEFQPRVFSSPTENQ